jgi:hypothetical protein
LMENVQSQEQHNTLNEKGKSRRRRR